MAEEPLSSLSKVKTTNNGLQGNCTPAYGRRVAPQPPSTMGEIIGNKSPLQSKEPSSVSINHEGISQKTTQSAPTATVQHQQQVNSNQEQPEVCQSPPNIPQQQPQPNIQNYSKHRQAYHIPFSNMPQKYLNTQTGQRQTLSTNHYEEPMFKHMQKHKPHTKGNNGISPTREEYPNTHWYFKDRYIIEPVVPQRQVASQPNSPVQHYAYPAAHSLSQREYMQSIRQRCDGAGLHEPEYFAPSTQSFQHPVYPHQMAGEPQHQQSHTQPMHSQQQQDTQQTVLKPSPRYPQMQSASRTISRQSSDLHKDMSPLQKIPEDQSEGSRQSLLDDATSETSTGRSNTQETASQSSSRRQVPPETVPLDPIIEGASVHNEPQIASQ